MGTISWNTATLATFENGIVYHGVSFWREQIGSYNSDYIYDSHGYTVAKISYNSAINTKFGSSETYCTCDDRKVYKGGSTWNSTLALYEGDTCGALAATVLHFKLYLSSSNDNTVKNVTKDINNTNSCQNSNDENVSIGYGWIIPLAIIVDTIVFFFTDWGHQMMLQAAGVQFLLLTVISSVISALIAIKCTKKKFFDELLSVSISLYIIDYVLLIISTLIDGHSKGLLDFGTVLMALIGCLIPVLGIATPFCLIVALLSYLVKQKWKK